MNDTVECCNHLRGRLVNRDDKRRLRLLRNGVELLHDCQCREGIKARRWLVQDHNLGLGDERSGNREETPLSTSEHTLPPPFPNLHVLLFLVDEADELENLLDCGDGLLERFGKVTLPNEEKMVSRRVEWVEHLFLGNKGHAVRIHGGFG